jgi:hypothetical protein
MRRQADSSYLWSLNTLSSVKLRRLTRRNDFRSTMWPMPIVAMKPNDQLGGPLRQRFSCAGSNDLHNGDARGIVDEDVDELPADTIVSVDHTGLRSGDAVPYGTDASEFLEC